MKLILVLSLLVLLAACTAEQPAIGSYVLSGDERIIVDDVYTLTYEEEEFFWEVNGSQRSVDICNSGWSGAGERDIPYIIISQKTEECYLSILRLSQSPLGEFEAQQIQEQVVWYEKVGTRYQLNIFSSSGLSVEPIVQGENELITLNGPLTITLQDETITIN